MSLEGKVAIITGASSGIGYATALALSKAGAKVAIGARRVDKLEQLENEVKKNGGEALARKNLMLQKKLIVMPLSNRQ